MNARNRTGLGRGLGDLIQRTDPDLAPHQGTDAVVPKIGRASCRERV